MPIRLVVNGFFRSGTSIVWSILRESNLDHDVFYEACHSELFLHVEEFRRNPQLDPVHNMSLWNEYLKYPDLVTRLRWTHPYVGCVFPENMQGLIPYLHIYHALPRRSILQSNRWHLLLQSIQQEIQCGVVHIARNPFDVYRSIKNVYFNTGSSLDRIMKRAMWSALPGRAFQIREMYAFIARRYALPPQSTGVKGALSGKLLSPWNQFLIAWVIANYEAIRQTEATGGVMVSYEALLNSPGDFAEALHEKYGIKFRWEGVLREGKRTAFLEPAQYKALRSISERLGIRRELECIIARLCI